MAYKSKKPKKESPQLLYLRKRREEEYERVKHDEVGFRRLEKTRRGNR